MTKLTTEQLMKALEDLGLEDKIILRNYDFETAVIGTDVLTGRVIYDYGKMVEYLVEKEGWEHIDAMDWIDYNTLRALPYMGENAPIIMDNISEFLKDYEVEENE